MRSAGGSVDDVRGDQRLRLGLESAAGASAAAAWSGSCERQVYGSRLGDRDRLHLRGSLLDGERFRLGNRCRCDVKDGRLGRWGSGKVNGRWRPALSGRGDRCGHDRRCDDRLLEHRLGDQLVRRCQNLDPLEGAGVLTTRWRTRFGKASPAPGASTTGGSGAVGDRESQVGEDRGLGLHVRLGSRGDQAPARPRPPAARRPRPGPARAPGSARRERPGPRRRGVSTSSTSRIR